MHDRWPIPSLGRHMAPLTSDLHSSKPGRRIVVGFDGSTLSHLAVDYLAQQARPEDVVVIVHAWGSARTNGSTNDDSLEAQHRRSIGGAILDTALSPTGPPLRAQHVLELREGPATSALVAAAQEHDADFIVLGAAGVGSVARGLGSVAKGVLERSERPVLVVPRLQREPHVSLA